MTQPFEVVQANRASLPRSVSDTDEMPKPCCFQLSVKGGDQHTQWESFTVFLQKDKWPPLHKYCQPKSPCHMLHLQSHVNRQPIAYVGLYCVTVVDGVILIWCHLRLECANYNVLQIPIKNTSTVKLQLFRGKADRMEN